MTPPKLKLVNAPALRAALYARFSSDVQKDRSIEDQFFDLEKAAKRFGFKLDKRHYFCDRAQSATTLFDRPGLTRELIGAAGKNEFDVVLVEATDRLARTQADLFWLADRFNFDMVKIFTPGGEVSDLQLTFDSHSNADMIKKLRIRVKRGHDAIARQGLIPGRVAYGYDLVEHQPGVKVINREQAKIVVRVFKEYAAGKSPRQIAADLMADKIPSPSGAAHWNFQSIVGGAGKKRGMIHNQLYVGVYLKNRFVNVKNPSTGKVITRAADPDDLITAQVPHLRIIDQKLWDAVHKIRTMRGNKKFGASGQVQRAVVPRMPHLLAGLLRCAECNGKMIVNASDRNGVKRVCCSAALNRQSCKHGKTYSLDKLTALAVESMCSHLTDPEFMKEKAREKVLEFARIEKENSGVRQAAQKQYDRLDMQIKKLVRVIEDEDDMPKELLASLKAKEIERKGLEERIRLLGAESNVATLHPHTIKAFGKSIETLHAKLRRNPNDPECRMAFGNIIDSIIVHPTAYDAPYDVSLYARLSAITGVDLFPAARSMKEIVAAEGLVRTDRGGLDTSSTSSGIRPRRRCHAILKPKRGQTAS
jgi:site-specific DNA recombinase